MQFIMTIVLILIVIYIAVFDGDIEVVKRKLNMDNIKSRNKDVKEGKEKNKKIKNIDNAKYTQDILPFKEGEGCVRSIGKPNEDSLIVKKENEYVGILEVYGANYNLLSYKEKLMLEEGFQRLLNGLEYPIQIYVQSRKLDLDNYYSIYEKRLEELKSELESNDKKLNILSEEDKIQELKIKSLRLLNQIDYGEKVINFIRAITSGADVLDKKYYIIIPYKYDTSKFDTEQNDEEKFMTAFNTISTRISSIRQALESSNISSKMLNAIEISELIYVSYNKSESEKYKFERAINTAFNDFIVTSRPVEYKIIEEEKKKLKEIMNA